MAHVVGHYTDRLAILQGERRSPLLKFTAQRSPSMYGNSVRVAFTLKDGAATVSFGTQTLVTCYKHVVH